MEGDEDNYDEDEEDEDEEEEEEEEDFKSPKAVISKEDSSKYPYMNIVTELLAQLKKKYPQYDLNGWRNTWILKPGGKSRGRGIKCFRSYDLMM